MISEYKYIDPEAAKMLTEKPLTEEDVGKTPNEIMLVRIYQHLKSTNQIVWVWKIKLKKQNQSLGITRNRL